MQFKWITVQLLSGVLEQITDAMLLQQGVFTKEYLLTHIGVVPWQRGSRTLFTGSDAGKFLLVLNLDHWNKYSHYNLNFLVSCFLPTVFDDNF